MDSQQRPERRTALIATELQRYNVDIAALQETRLPLEGALTEEGAGYTFYWKGLRSEDPRIHGVGFAIRKTILKDIIETPKGHNERLMSIRIPLAKGSYATIICAYAPTLDSEEAINDQFYNDLENLIQNIPNSDKIIILGDMNSRVGQDAELWPGVIGRQGMGKMNKNGLRLLTFCAENRFAITNTFFQMKNRYKATWLHPRSKHGHQIDFIIVKRQDLKDVRVTKVKRGAECWTDHHLLLSKMNVIIRPKSRQQSTTNKRLNCATLNDNAKKEDLQERLARELENCTIEHGPKSQEDIDSFWGEFVNCVHQTALECLGTIRKRNRDWFDESNQEIIQLLAQKNKAHDAYLANPSSTPLKTHWQNIRADTQRTLRKLQDEWWTARAQEIQRYADENQTHNFYEAIKAIHGPSRNSATPVRSADDQTLITDKQGILKRWADHFAQLLNRVNYCDHTIFDELPQLPLSPELDAPPSLDEVEKAVKQLKNNKSSGSDGIPSEIYKCGGARITEVLHNFFSICWTNGMIPSHWKKGDIVTIYKRKGDKAVCGNSRGITLLDVAGKILGKVLLVRLLALLNNDILPETQCGFRSERSTVDMIFTCRQLIEKSIEQREHFSTAFIDLTKAFDTINRDMMFIVLAKIGCPPTFIQMIRQFHQDTLARVISSGESSDYFPVNVGVKQGCVLAPILFNTYLIAVTHNYYQQTSPDHGINIKHRFDGSLFNLRRFNARTKCQNTAILELQYADDAAAIAKEPTHLQEQLSILNEAYRRAGLQVNITKTEILTIPNNARQPITINDEQLKQVDHFTYLGSIISQNGTNDREITNRIHQASAAFGRLRDRVFLNRDLHLKTKVAVYQAICVSTLLYGSETWTPYRRQIKTLETFHIRCLQRILRVTWQDRITHNEILERTLCDSIEAQIAKRSLKWIGHVIRMQDNRLPKKVLFAELAQGTRSAGGQKKRYKDHLKTTLKACNINPSQLETLAENRPAWHRAVTQGTQNLETVRRNHREQLRETRHRRQQAQVLNQPTPHTCNICQRGFLTRTGLLSHSRAHERRNGRGRRRADGQP